MASMRRRSRSGPVGAAQDIAAAGAHRNALSGILVLLVEDDESSRDALTLLFGYYGAHVLAAGSVADALRQYGFGEPDLIVSDIGLPGEDGYALIRRVRMRDQARGAWTPAIAVSGIVGPDTDARARAAGFDEFLAKPVDVGTLLATARSLVEAN